MKKKFLIFVLLLSVLLQTGVSFAQESVRDVFDYLDSVLILHEGRNSREFDSLKGKKSL